MTLPFFARDRERIGQFTLLNRLPSMWVFREYVEDGGLIYGPNRTVMSRRIADYVHRIARGAKPGELPIERSRSAATRKRVGFMRTLPVSGGKWLNKPSAADRRLPGVKGQHCPPLFSRRTAQGCSVGLSTRSTSRAIH